VESIISLLPKMPAPTDTHRMRRLMEPGQNAKLQLKVVHRKLDQFHTHPLSIPNSVIRKKERNGYAFPKIAVPQK
jgi:hypothetical protein